MTIKEEIQNKWTKEEITETLDLMFDMHFSNCRVKNPILFCKIMEYLAELEA